MNEPILFNIVDTLSKKITKISPEFMQERPIASNMFYGFVGAYMTVRASTWLISKALNPKLLNFYANAENVISKVLPFAVLGYAIIDPDGARELMQTHPVYTAGMISATIGASAGLKHDSYRIKKNLEALANAKEKL